VVPGCASQWAGVSESQINTKMSGWVTPDVVNSAVRILRALQDDPESQVSGCNEGTYNQLVMALVVGCICFTCLFGGTVSWFAGQTTHSDVLKGEGDVKRADMNVESHLLSNETAIQESEEIFLRHSRGETLSADEDTRRKQELDWTVPNEKRSNDYRGTKAAGATPDAEGTEWAWKGWAFETTNEDIDKMGVGLGIYFRFLAGMAATWLFLSAVTAPHLAFNYRGSMLTSHPKATSNSSAIMKTLTGNMGDEIGQEGDGFSMNITVGCETLETGDIIPVLGALDAFATLLYVLFCYFWLAKKIPEIDEQAGNTNITPGDFAVEVWGLARQLGDDKHKDYETLLHDHFTFIQENIDQQVQKGKTSWYSFLCGCMCCFGYAGRPADTDTWPVEYEKDGKTPKIDPDVGKAEEGKIVDGKWVSRVCEVSLVRDFKGRIGKFKKLADLEKQIELERMKSWAEVVEKGSNDAAKDKLEKKKEAASDKVTKEIKDDKKVTIERDVLRAIVVFNRKQDKEAIISEYRFAKYRLGRCFQWKSMRFEGKALWIKEPDEPTNLLWENADAPYKQRVIRGCIVTILVAVLMIISFLMILSGSFAKTVLMVQLPIECNEMGASVSASAMEADLFNNWYQDGSDTGKCFDHGGAELDCPWCADGTSPAARSDWESDLGKGFNRPDSDYGVDTEVCVEYTLLKDLHAAGLYNDARGWCFCEDWFRSYGVDKNSRYESFMANKREMEAAECYETYGDGVDGADAFQCEAVNTVCEGWSKSPEICADWKVPDVTPDLEADDKFDMLLYSSPHGLDCQCDTITSASEQADNWQELQDLASSNSTFEHVKYVCDQRIAMSSAMSMYNLLGTLITVVVNAALKIILIALAKWQRPLSVSALENSTMIKIFYATFMNTAIIILIINASFFPGGENGYHEMTFEWYMMVALPLATTLLTNAVVANVSTLGGTAAALLQQWCIRGKKCLFCCTPKMAPSWDAAPYKMHQQEIYDKLTFPEFNISVRFSLAISTIFCTLMYSSAMPILNFVAFIYFFLAYFVDRYNLLRASRTPPQYDTSIPKKAIQMCLKGAVLHCAVAIWVFGNPVMFPSDEIIDVNAVAAGVDEYDYTTTTMMPGLEGFARRAQSNDMQPRVYPPATHRLDNLAQKFFLQTNFDFPLMKHTQMVMNYVGPRVFHVMGDVEITTRDFVAPVHRMLAGEWQGTPTDAPPEAVGAQWPNTKEDPTHPEQVDYVTQSTSRAFKSSTICLLLLLLYLVGTLTTRFILGLLLGSKANIVIAKCTYICCKLPLKLCFFVCCCCCKKVCGAKAEQVHQDPDVESPAGEEKAEDGEEVEDDLAMKTTYNFQKENMKAECSNKVSYRMDDPNCDASRWMNAMDNAIKRALRADDEEASPKEKSP